MSMFCYQCEQTAKGQGCTVRGVCAAACAPSDADGMSSVANVSVASVVMNTPRRYDMRGIVPTTHTKLIEDREVDALLTLRRIILNLNSTRGH